MDFRFADEQRMLVETVRGFIAAELTPLEDEIERTGVLRPELAQAILTPVPFSTVPEAWGTTVSGISF